MILVRRKLDDHPGYRLIGVWPFQSAEALAFNIDEFTDPVFGNQFTNIRSGGICLNNGDKDEIIMPASDDDDERDIPEVTVYGTSWEILEAFHYGEQTFFWLKHAVDEKLDDYGMQWPEDFLKPVNEVPE